MRFTSKMAIIGPREVVEGFRALGFLTFPCKTCKEASEILVFAQEECSIIFIFEDMARDLEWEIKEISKDPRINIVMIPPVTGSIGLAAEKISSAVRSATGSEALTRGRG